MEKLKLVNCHEKYWEFVRQLRMDKRVISGFIEQNEITPDMQKKYMNKYSDNYRIAIYNNEPAGFVGVIDDDIRVCTHPDFQNKGIGKFMINECYKIFPNAYAKVKIDNEASLKLFESCGFKKKYIIFEKY